jgi:hypothetical protein
MCGMKSQAANTPAVTTDAKVGKVPSQHAAELLVLVPDRPVPHCAALMIDHLLGTSKAIFCRQLRHYRPALP